MKALFIVLVLCAVSLAGCGETNMLTGNPIGAPLTRQGVTLDNGCMADAIECCTELRGSGAEAQILLVRYNVDGAAYGHALTRFYWPPRFGVDGKGRLNAYSVPYVYDRKNASTPIPAKVDAGNATELGKYMLPNVTWAAWADQTPYQDLQNR